MGHERPAFTPKISRRSHKYFHHLLAALSSVSGKKAQQLSLAGAGGTGGPGVKGFHFAGASLAVFASGDFDPSFFPSTRQRRPRQSQSKHPLASSPNAHVQQPPALCELYPFLFFLLPETCSNPHAHPPNTSTIYYIDR